MDKNTLIQIIKDNPIVKRFEQLTGKNLEWLIENIKVELPDNYSQWDPQDLAFCIANGALNVENLQEISASQWAISANSFDDFKHFSEIRDAALLVEHNLNLSLLNSDLSDYIEKAELKAKNWLIKKQNQVNASKKRSHPDFECWIESQLCKNSKVRTKSLWTSIPINDSESFYRDEEKIIFNSKQGKVRKPIKYDAFESIVTKIRKKILNTVVI